MSGARFAVTPDEIVGEGESGSASIDLAFGYTGDYQATNHGLEAAVVTSDNVLQDPIKHMIPLMVSPTGTISCSMAALCSG